MSVFSILISVFRILIDVLINIDVDVKHYVFAFSVLMSVCSKLIF